MKNYTDNDYALNKFSNGIVYRFADEVIEVTLEDYLRENPDKSEEDFQLLKQLSDEMYMEQDRKDYAQTRKNVPLNKLEESDKLATKTLENMYIEQQDERMFEEAVFKNMTPKQARRLYLCVYKGLSCRKIANLEGVHFRSVYDSLVLARKKIKKFKKK